MLCSAMADHSRLILLAVLASAAVASMEMLSGIEEFVPDGLGSVPDNSTVWCIPHELVHDVVDASDYIRVDIHEFYAKKCLKVPKGHIYCDHIYDKPLWCWLQTGTQITPNLPRTTTQAQVGSGSESGSDISGLEPVA